MQIVTKLKHHSIFILLLLAVTSTVSLANNSIKKSVTADYKNYLSDLFIHFHKNPELSLQEFKTAKRKNTGY